MDLEVQTLSDSKEEIAEWSRFCGVCFAGKDPTVNSSYFERKVFNDPNFLPEHIFIIRSNEGSIVATLRVFIRRINWEKDNGDKAVATVMGIGEVCTKADFRKQGLSKKILKAALCYGKKKNFQLASLHCQEWVKPLYESVGFRSVDTFYCELGLDAVVKPDISSVVKVEAFDIENGEIPWNVMDDIYERNNYYIGTTIRSDDIRFWKDWIKNAMKRRQTGRVFVAYKCGADGSYSTSCGLGYLLAYRLEEDNKIKISEMSIDETFDCLDKHNPVQTVFYKLAEAATEHFSTKVMVCPKLILNKISLQLETAQSCINIKDSGWMYQSLSTEALQLPKEHLVWQTDGF